MLQEKLPNQSQLNLYIPVLQQILNPKHELVKLSSLIKWHELEMTLSKKYNNVVPKELNKLLELPGVGRKTAGCLLVYAYRIPAIPAIKPLIMKAKLLICATLRPIADAASSSSMPADVSEDRYHLFQMVGWQTGWPRGRHDHQQ